MFVIKKKRTGDIELSLTLNPVAKLLSGLTKLDLLFSRKIFYLLPMGLGIGFGLGLVIFSQPASLRAGLSANQPTLTPEQLTLPAQKRTYFVAPQDKFSLIAATWNNQTVFFPGWTSSDKQLVIASSQLSLDQIELGETLEVLATNQGIYRYQVYHLKEVAGQNINGLKNEPEAGLILIKPSNWLGTKAQVVLAK